MHTMLRISRLVPAILVLAALLLSLRAPTSYAQSSCDQPVIDDAGVFDAQIDQVEAAADRLTSSGAQVRIRTLASYAPASSLDDYAKQLEQSCSSWRTADGKRQPELLLLLLSIGERKTGIYYGANWTRALDNRWSDLQSETINPHFQRGDFAGGFVAGLEEIGKARTVAAGQPASGSTAAAPTGDASGLGYCFGIFGAVGALITGGVGLQRRRKAQQLRRAAQQRASDARRSVVTPIVALPKQIDDLQLRLKLLSAQIAAEDAEPLRASLAEVQQLHEQALLAFDAIKETDPEHAKLSTAEYEALAQQYEQMLPQAEQASSAASQFQEQIQRVEQTIERMPQTISQDHAALEQARAQVAAIAGRGFKVDAQQTLLEQAATALAETEQAVEQRRFMLASERAAQAEALIASASEQAEALPATSAQLAADLDRLTERSAQASALIASGHATFQTISSSYTPASWAAIKQNGSRAERLYADSQQAIATAHAAATMERQEWEQARAQVTAADAALQEVGTLIAAIVALKARLEAAQAEAPALIAATHDERSAIEHELKQYSADVPEAIWQQLRGAADDLAAAEQALQPAQPNYLDVVERAERARTAAQTALAAARAAHQAAEELRQRVAETLSNAEQAIETAKSYISSAPSGDISGSARYDLRQARELLKKAKQSDDLEAKLQHAAKAQAEALSAYTRAQRDVADAEQERNAAAAAVAAAATHSSHHSSSSSSDSGGSSFSWSSDSGGSSSSWDSGSSSSSDGGGGSSSW